MGENAFFYRLIHLHLHGSACLLQLINNCEYLDSSIEDEVLSFNETLRAGVQV